MKIKDFTGTLVVAGVLACAVPAKADITASYKLGDSEDWVQARAELSMSVEVSDQADFRLSLIGVPGYVLSQGGTLYLVLENEAGPRVMRVADVDAIALENAQAQGTLSSQADLEQLDDRVEWRETGDRSVAEWSGLGFGVTLKGGPEPERDMLVVADDPQLKPLAIPFIALQPDPHGWSPFASTIPGLLVPGTREIFERGGPLRLMFLVIDKVDFDDIDPARLTFPGQAMTREEIRESGVLFPRPAADSSDSP